MRLDLGWCVESALASEAMQSPGGEILVERAAAGGEQERHLLNLARTPLQKEWVQGAEAHRHGGAPAHSICMFRSTPACPGHSASSPLSPSKAASLH